MVSKHVQRIVTIDNGTFKDYLGLCNLDVEVFPSQKSPAKLYNKILDDSSGVVCIIHSDVTCSNLLEAVDKTIDEYGINIPLGVVGARPRFTTWAKKNKSFLLDTCDSCCIVLDSNKEIRFDEEVFDSYHLFVEDICVQYGGCRTLLLDAYEGEGVKMLEDEFWFIHHSKTVNQLGFSWGTYSQYKDKMFDKWGRFICTT